jgi:hypothetical protein
MLRSLFEAIPSPVIEPLAVCLEMPGIALKSAHSVNQTRKSHQLEKVADDGARDEQLTVVNSLQRAKLFRVSSAVVGAPTFCNR